MGAKRTAWHFYFCILLRRFAPRCFEIRDEVPLSEEPPRMDYLLFRRAAESPDAETGQTLRGLWPLLPRVTIAELKTIGRPYDKGNLDRLWSYAHAYYASEHKSLEGRENLNALLIVPCRTPTLDADAKAMGLAWVDLGGGYWRVTGGLFGLYAVELDVVAERLDEDLLALYSHNEVRTPQARAFWGELVGAEAKMDVQELEGYEEVVQKFLNALTPKQRLAGLLPEQRLAGLSPEQVLLTLPDDMLRMLPDNLLAGFSDAGRAALHKRIGRP